MGDPACWCRLSTEMHGVWTSGYGVPEAGGKEYQRNPQSLKFVIIQSYIRIYKYIRKTFAKSAFSACFSAGNMVKSFIVIYYSSVIREIPCA